MLTICNKSDLQGTCAPTLSGSIIFIKAQICVVTSEENFGLEYSDMWTNIGPVIVAKDLGIYSDLRHQLKNLESVDKEILDL